MGEVSRMEGHIFSLCFVCFRLSLSFSLFVVLVSRATLCDTNMVG